MKQNLPDTKISTQPKKKLQTTKICLALVMRIVFFLFFVVLSNFLCSTHHYSPLCLWCLVRVPRILSFALIFISFCLYFCGSLLFHCVCAFSVHFIFSVYFWWCVYGRALLDFFNIITVGLGQIYLIHTHIKINILGRIWKRKNFILWSVNCKVSE